MEKLIDYIKNCIVPKDETEMVVLDNYDANIFGSMKQDGIMVVKNSDSVKNSLYNIDHINVPGYTIIRKNFPKQIEWLNYDGSVSFTDSREPIYRRLIPPPHESVNHQKIIYSFIQQCNGLDKNYLEYGVRTGDSIEVISKYVSKCYGVDMVPYSPKNTNIEMHVMSTDEFSSVHLPNITFDFAFIDADHSSKQVIIDFDNIFKYINKGGYIFLHDTYPCLEEMITPYYCNDCYKSPLLIKDKYLPTQYEILTFPLNPGVTVIRKI